MPAWAVRVDALQQQVPQVGCRCYLMRWTEQLSVCPAQVLVQLALVWSAQVLEQFVLVWPVLVMVQLELERVLQAQVLYSVYHCVVPVDR